jgi:hypothetical protein
MEREEQIRRLAYTIWEREGYPEGRAVEHWLKAETILQSDGAETTTLQSESSETILQRQPSETIVQSQQPQPSEKKSRKTSKPINKQKTVRRTRSPQKPASH